jgi:predicted nucleic-acid-binding protein
VKKVSFDTNVFLRLLLDVDTHQHELAIKSFNTHDKVFISSTAIIETVYILGAHYGVPRHVVADTVLEMLSHEKVVSDRDVFAGAFRDYVEHSSLSIEDCVLAAESEHCSAVPLLTFDRALSKKLLSAQLLY